MNAVSILVPHLRITCQYLHLLMTKQLRSPRYVSMVQQLKGSAPQKACASSRDRHPRPHQYANTSAAIIGRLYIIPLSRKEEEKKTELMIQFRVIEVGEVIDGTSGKF